tara:strand:+ start:579 stop:779 length:201 start_codon:yes stop_codon:yes gene_type:complete
MDKGKIIAHIMTNEVMNENYRGTQRINKHEFILNTTSQTIWKKLFQITKSIIDKYVQYAGRKGKRY